MSLPALLPRHCSRFISCSPGCAALAQRRSCAAAATRFASFIFFFVPAPLPHHCCVPPAVRSASFIS
eukprot:14248426-Alexandrium_andersonii.AAC.1